MNVDQTAPLATDSSAVGAAIGRIPSACAILTAQHAGRASAMLVSWIQQAAFDPPSITVAIKQGRPIVPLIEIAGRFALNLLGDPPTAMLKHFGKGFSLEEDAFKGLTTKPSDFGPLLTDCIAHLGCAVTHRVTIGDHDLYAAQVVMGSTADATVPYVHLRKSGLGY